MRTIVLPLASLMLTALLVACGGGSGAGQGGAGGGGGTSNTSSSSNSTSSATASSSTGSSSSGTGSSSSSSSGTGSSSSSSSSSSGGSVQPGLHVDIAGTPTTFDMGTAAVLTSGMTMTITGTHPIPAGGVQGLSMHLVHPTGLATGTYVCKPGASEPSVTMTYTNTATFAGLQADATHGDCSVTVTAIGASGTPAQGTFSATMVGPGGDATMFTNGSFDLIIY